MRDTRNPGREASWGQLQEYKGAKRSLLQTVQDIETKDLNHNFEKTESQYIARNTTGYQRDSESISKAHERTIFKGRLEVNPTGPRMRKFSRVIQRRSNQLFHFSNSVQAYEPISHCVGVNRPPENR
ncbi:unnamed protein product [Staurois parvus]|uniref:Uncharacterized protein n=1 Tax=Staurois parvus TaxID=386267 RepID=A0ABN9CE04_9NEOB|nr:unnamed protein product [Staurois parvus]